MSSARFSMAPAVDRRQRRLDMSVIVAIGCLHLSCLAAPFTFSWSGLALVPILGWLSAALGITLGYHRLLTHRSFRTSKAVEYLLTILGTLTWQGGPIRWVGTHRLHHRDSDQAADPHTPRHGFTWSHALWCMYQDTDRFKPADAARDLQRDPFMRWIERFFWVPQVLLAAMLYAMAWWWSGHELALSWLIWGVGVRTVVSYHTTWLVNSAAHTWGYRNFDTNDGSKNNWWVALLSFGEGWHNNHHAQQRSAAHGMRWFELDLTYWMIRALGAVGLAWNITRPQAPARRGQGELSQAA